LEPYRQAVELDPDWVDAQMGLGIVLLNLEDCESALSQFEEVLKLDAENSLAQEGAAACEEQ
jgi:lipoprotein NlpI